MKKEKIFPREEFLQEFEKIWQEARNFIEQDLQLEWDKTKDDLTFRYALDLLEKNQYLNLTALTEAEEVAYLHFVDSLTLQNVLDSLAFSAKIPTNRDLVMADIGTGAGFPGLYIHSLFPKKQIFLVDSLKKRLTYLEELAAKLASQDGVTTVHGRAEDLGHLAHLREKVDVVVARAVAALPSLLELCAPFVKVGGYFIAMKSKKEELALAKKAMKLLNMDLVFTKEFSLPYENSQRKLYVFQKKASLASKFPRKPPLVLKKPLL